METAIDPDVDARLELDDCPKYELSEDVLKAACPRGWNPTEKMLEFARTYIAARATDTVAVMAFKAGVDRTSLRRWRRSPHFQSWLTEVALKAAGTCVPRVWKAMIEKAVKGDKACAKMVVERFDPFYVSPRVKARVEEESWAAKPGEKPPDDMVKRVREIQGSPEQVQAFVQGQPADDTVPESTVARNGGSLNRPEPKDGPAEEVIPEGDAATQRAADGHGDGGGKAAVD